MEASQSDPDVKLQFGMLVAIPGSRQVNALSTLNLRGERSVTCQAECDSDPSTGALPASCPAVCEEFRKQPDALERASELDEEYGVPAAAAGVLGAGWEASCMNSSATYNVPLELTTPTPTYRNPGSVRFA